MKFKLAMFLLFWQIFSVTAHAQSYLRGVNIMDLAISESVAPGEYGTNYTRPSAEAIRALRERGITVIRIPFRWERIQRYFYGPMDWTYMWHMQQVLLDANAVGMKVILDMHNYCRFYLTDGSLVRCGDANGPTRESLSDAWINITQAIRSNPAAYNAVYAYDIMNEPYDLPSADGMPPERLWESYSQAVVSSLRASGEGALLMVEGYSFASAARWPSIHPSPWISDSSNNIMYQAHAYMDNDQSGTFQYSFAQETVFANSQGYDSVSSRAISQIQQFTNWLANNNVRGFLGEYGCPNSAVKGDAETPEWNGACDRILSFLDSVGLGATLWGTGSWLGAADNVLNAYVLPGNGNSSIIPLSQSWTVEAHPAR